MDEFVKLKATIDAANEQITEAMITRIAHETGIPRAIVSARMDQMSARDRDLRAAVFKSLWWGHPVQLPPEL